jgi:hypothetical protein
MSLCAITARYQINTSTDQAEHLGAKAYSASKRAKDHVWQLVSGNLLSGLALLAIILIIEVYRKQDKAVKKGKQEALNEELRKQIERRLYGNTK